ncbi:MAG TPA: right-handed parallel beta-helix repeat-containing protein [Solirubrobacterales bacterium]|nr:right-handed parallel beta-helix repeat-containing protein [Solirubrobacterales bacterium]
MTPRLTMRLLVAAAALAAVGALIVLGASAPAAGADVSCAEFASPSGSDGSGDGSLANPYASPQKLADSLAAGQTGCLRAGTYEFSLLSVRSPNITLAPYGSDSATLRGPIKVLPSGAGSTIEGLTLDGVNSNLGCTGTCGGGSPRIYADGVVLRDNEITDEHTGICVMVGSYYSDPPPRGVVIEHNRIHDCGRLPAGNHDHGIYVSESRDAVIRDNWIYDNADRGIQLYPDAIGTTITGNVIYGNGEAQNFSCDASSCSKDNVVAGNIIADSVVRWNVYANSQGATPDGSNVLRDNCLYASRSGYTDNGGVDSAPAFYSESANLVANPRFADPSRGDFVLDPASPCLAKYTGTMSLPQGSTGGGGGTGGGSAPANTSLPTISGTAQVGQKLSASNGSWSGSPTSYAYQWRRCDGSGSSCASIAGATSNGYQPTSADIGSTIRVLVTATNSSGSASASSDATAAVAAATTTVVKITGNGNKGRPHPKARGAVFLGPAGSAARSARVHGAVALTLYRRSNGDWRAISRARLSPLRVDGHFRKRLNVFHEHRLYTGTYRVKADYPGSRIARPSVSRSPRFTIQR